MTSGVGLGLGLDLSRRMASAGGGAGPDVTAPTLTLPTDAANGTTGASIGVTTNEANGTLYWFVWPQTTAPTAAVLKAGTNATAYGSQAVSATGVQSASPTGLESGQTYYAHFLHRDAAGNDSAIVSGDGFTTTALSPTASTYSEDFSAVADNTRLVAGDTGSPPNLGWSAFADDGATTGEKWNAWVIGNQIMKRTSGGVGDFTEPGKYFLSPTDLANANHYFQVKVRSFATEIRLCVAGTDDANKASMAIAGSTTCTFVHQVAATKTTVGTLSPVATARFQGGVNGSYSPYAADDVITVRVYGGTAYLSRNGAPVGLTSGYTVSTLTGTRTGLSTYSDTFRNLDDVKTGPLAGRLTLNAPKRSYSRVQRLGGYTNGAADIAISGTYFGTVSGLQWALFSPTTGATLKSWTAVNSPTIAGGNWSGTIRVPCGLNGVGGYRLGIRASNDTWVEVQAQSQFFVCYTVILVGQSNAKYLTNTGATVTDHDGGSVYIQADPANPIVEGSNVATSTWDNSTAEGTSLDRACGNLSRGLSVALGLPVLVANDAIPATGASASDPNGTAVQNGIQQSVYLQGHLAFWGNSFDAIVASQGENEISAGSGSGTWLSQWQTNITNWRALSGQPSGTTIPVFFAVTGRYTGTPGDTAAADAAANTIRAAQIAIAGSISDTYVAYHHADATMTDTFHYVNTANGYPLINTKLMLSMRKVLAGGAYDGRGPRVAGTATRSGATITVPITLNGATSISGTALTGWVVSSNADMSSPKTISSADVSGSNVVIVLSADPGAPVYVAYHRGYNPTVTSQVTGSYSGGESITLEPCPTPFLTST